MPGMRRVLLNAPMVLLLLQSPELAEACLPCGGDNHRGVVKVRDKLQEAFRLSMTVADCDGADQLQTCRSIEARHRSGEGARQRASSCRDRRGR